jgi:rRNA maturation endonuclease Nob1
MLHKYKECEKCGTRFIEVRESKLCPSCRSKAEKNFVKVTEYIYDNPSANLAEIADETGVAESDIETWSVEGKIKDYIRPAVRCEVCGKGIKIGRICQKCQSGLEPDMPDFPDDREGKHGVMHVNKNKRR